MRYNKLKNIAYILILMLLVGVLTAVIKRHATLHGHSDARFRPKDVPPIHHHSKRTHHRAQAAYRHDA